MAAFERLGMVPQLAQAVEEMDWILPTDIQDEAIPMILGGGDVLMAAETGSGKTGAFCLPVIQIVHEDLISQREGKTSISATTPSASSKWKMNVHDRGEAMAIDSEGLLCQSRDMNGWHGTRSNKAVSGKGCYYYEATVTDEGLCRVGWSTEKARLDLGTDGFSYGFGGTGKKSHKKQFDSYGEPFGMNDVIGCFLDLNRFEIKWSKNGVDLGKAYDIQPQMKNEQFYAAVVLKNAEMRMDFGDGLKYKPKGYQPLNLAAAEFVTNSKIVAAGAVSHKPSNNAPQCLVVEPSRELAEQTFKQIEHFKKNISNPSVRTCLVIGGVNVRDQMSVINAGVDIVVGTPGRVEDLISGGQLALHQVRFFILDEADALLSQGYGELINRMHKQIPKVTNDGKRLQMIVCSATLKSFDVKKMAERLMYFPTWIDLKGSLPETVHHVVCIVDPEVDTEWTYLKRHINTDGVHHQGKSHNLSQAETLSEGVKVLKGEYVIKAIEKHHMTRVLIFCRTKLDCDNLERYLNEKCRGRITAVCLHSDIKPQLRKDNLERFKNEKVNILICTDVAARGIDVKGLPHVINVTLPDDKNNYIHRIGRVGRAERMGLAISFVAKVKEKVWYHSNCNTRGKGCYNTNLTDQGGCCIWYNEPQLLGDIEEEMGVTIDQISTDMEVPVAEFDGKVVYGKKRQATGPMYKGHVAQLAPTVQELARLENRVQTSFLELKYGKRFCT